MKYHQLRNDNKLCSISLLCAESRKEPLGEVPGLGSPPFLSIFIYNIKRIESVLTLTAIYDAIRGE